MENVILKDYRVSGWDTRDAIRWSFHWCTFAVNAGHFAFENFEQKDWSEMAEYFTHE